MIKFFNFFLIFFFFFLKYANCIEIVDSKIYKKSTNVLGSEVSYAIFDIDLSDDLYLYDTVSCPNSQSCPGPADPSNPTLDCSCDYTQCPPKPMDSACTNTCVVDGNHTCTIGTFETIQLDTVYNFSINSTKQLRFKADGTNCYGYSLKVNSIDGYGITSIGSSLYSNDARSMVTYQRNIQFHICPSDNTLSSAGTPKNSWTRDTFFIQISPVTSFYNFSLVLHSVKVNTTQVVSTCVSPLSTHTCVDLGKNYQFSVGDSVRSFYVLNITEEGYYFFNFPTIDQTMLYFISDSGNSKPAAGNATWELMEDIENHLLVYLKPINQNTPLVIYISIQSFYATVFSFSVTKEGNKYKYPISSFESYQAGTLGLRTTSKLYLSNGISYSTYTSQTTPTKKSFTILYPQKDINPLWPVSTIISSVSDYVTTTSNLNSNFTTFKPNSFQVSFLLEQNSGYIYTKYSDFDTIKNSTLVFHLNIFDVNGKPLDISVKFREVQLTCNIEQFNRVNSLVSSIEGSLFSISNTEKINNYRYNLDALTISDAWYSCQSQILSFFQIETYLGTKSLKNCPYSSAEPEFNKNPCCSPKVAYGQCCNPTEIPYNYTRNVLVNAKLVRDQCSSLDCTLSVLSDFNRSLSTIDDCTIPDFTITNIEYTATTVLRDCKNVLAAPYCSNDSDCSNYGNKTCDIYKRTCIPDFQMVDKSYIKCVLETLPRASLYYLLGGTISFDDSSVNTLYNNHLSIDCIGTQSIMDRSTFSYNSVVYPLCYINNECLDSTCLTKHDICFDGVVPDNALRLNSHVNNCESYGFCPYLDCEGLTQAQCQAQCVSKSFCGYCTNANTSCHIFDDSDVTGNCEDNNMCLLPDGSYLTGLTEEECNLKGSCSSSCGKKCVANVGGDAACYILTSKTSTSCASNGGTWSAQYSTCSISAQDSAACTSMNTNPNITFSWIDCGSKNYGECSGPKGNLFTCLTQDIPCDTESDCLSAGECSDAFYFESPTNPLYPSGLGRCTHAHTYFYTTVSCGPGVESDSPNGCFAKTPTFLNQSVCEKQPGYKWWVPARSQSECTSQLGCRIVDDPDLGNLPFNYNFNEMNIANCSACQDSFNEWTNKFTWTQAVWSPGVYKKAQQLTKSFVPNQNTSVFNYEKFYQSVMDALNSQTSELYRSQAFCRMERIQSNLNSLSCSCFGEGSSVCFESSVPLLGQPKVCADESSSFSFDYGIINFSNDSISESCQTLSISQRSREIYTSTVPDSLASNFVSYVKPDNYAVYNDKGAIVGTLISDGVMIKSQDGVKDIQVCFKPSDAMNFNQKYPVYDIAVQETENSRPIPTDSTLFINSDSAGLGYYCASFSTVSKGTPIYFQINRVEKWKDQSKEIFDDETKGLMYALAVVFLLVALGGFYELISLVYLYIKKVIVQFQLIHLLLVFVTGFIFIRSVYFFLLVNGKLLDSPVADYILVVLPTFIYFTSFTIIIILWYVIVFLVLKKNRGADTLSKRLYSMVFLINLVLYMLFIAIVLVFQYTKYSPVNDCGSRIYVPIKTSAAQKGVSIAYAVVQAFISLLLGAAFIYLGSSLYKRLHFGNVNTGSKTNHQNKVFILSIICSIGFLLHCAFVLVLVSDFKSIVFSFVGLIITEVIPAIAILYCFNPKEKQRDRNGNTIGASSTTRSTKLSRYNNDSPHESQASQASSNEI